MAEILKMGNPKLREVSLPVTTDEVGSPELDHHVASMIAALRKHNGVGIAAPQIGIQKQIVILEIGADNLRYDVAEAMEKTVLLNPVITWSSSETVGNWEGCLSVPNLRGYVKRPCAVMVTYMDLKGVSHQQRYEGFPAIVLQHERDHLDGILYVDRLESNRHLAFLEEFDTYIRGAPPTI